MVREFADLEGYMGETYATIEGFHAEVAQAVREQYLPDAAGGEVPRTIAGALLATAEKIDNIVAAFAVGEPPSGSKDPYGLRRAAMGMVNISFFHGLRYNVRYLAEFAYGLLERFPHLVAQDQVVAEATDFVLERLAKVLTDNDVNRDAVDAVLPTADEFADLRARAVSLDSFRSDPAWEDLVVVFTRPSNLAKKLPAGEAGLSVNPSLCSEEAERLLLAAWSEAAGGIVPLIRQQEYVDALRQLAALRPAVDRYFTDVLVMAEDEAVRLNRLRQLDWIVRSVRSVAYLDRLQG
jgi:glycyl-tRNA synthetase beta chain